MRGFNLTRLLGFFLLFDLLLQAFGLWRGWGLNPGLVSLSGDALEYWNWAGQIADGHLVGSTPFLSAPLYPYFLGLIRAFHGDLITVYVLQLLMRTATAWVLARVGQRLFGHAAYGLASALLFLWLQEPAYYAVRLLNSSLQLWVLSLLLLSCVRCQQNRSPRRLLLLGFLLGLSILSNPAFLLTIPCFILWLGWKPHQIQQTALTLGITLLTLAPATLHNYLATRKAPGGAEFILVSAQAGVTFAHGNAPGAVGTYRPMEGVSLNRLQQNDDAYRLAKEATGEEGWGVTSSFFFHRGLSYLLGNPAAALRLEWAKFRWFFCGRNYGDLYNINLENTDQDWPRQIPLPGGLLELGWILPAAFVGLVCFVRRQRRQALPYAALMLTTFLVVLVFWYSPRYRLPIAPLAVLFAPWGILQLAKRWPSKPAWVSVLALALLPPLGLETWTRLSHFDPLEDVRGQYEMHIGLHFVEQEQFSKALPRLQRALAEGTETAEVHHGIAECLVREGSYLGSMGQTQKANQLFRQAAEHYRQALQINPTRLDTGFSLGSVLAFLGQTSEAKAILQQSLAQAQQQQNQEMVNRLHQLLNSLPH